MMNLERLQRFGVSAFDTLLVPALALLLFSFYAKDIDDFFRAQEQENRRLLRRRSAYNMRLQEERKEEALWDLHSTYVTDEFTDFHINAEGCEVPAALKAKNISYKFDALFLISTSAANLYNRRMLRHLYSMYANTKPYRIKPIFLVGLSTDIVIQANIEREDYQYRDMLQGGFIDHYFNLTYKTIMGYRWATENCRDVKLILKMDDDVYLDVFKFFDYFLPILPKKKRMIYGFLNHHPRVFREGKYRVAVEEYKEKEYPNFCSGFFVVPTLDLIDEIYEASKIVKFFRLEDVFTYGLVREKMVDVQLVHLDVITYEWRAYRDCVHDYKYRCKYMAVEAPPLELLTCYDQVMEERRKLGLPGGSVENL